MGVFLHIISIACRGVAVLGLMFAVFSPEILKKFFESKHSILQIVFISMCTMGLVLTFFRLGQ